MFFDNQNMFFDVASVATGGVTGKVIANEDGGDALNPLFLVVHTPVKTTVDVTITLKTSDSENMASAVTMASFTVAKGAQGELVKARLPYGAKKYLALTITGAIAGKVLAGLTQTVGLDDR